MRERRARSIPISMLLHEERRVWPSSKLTHIHSARLAQSVEHETLNLGVVGSSPTLGGHNFCILPVLRKSKGVLRIHAKMVGLFKVLEIWKF